MIQTIKKYLITIWKKNRIFKRNKIIALLISGLIIFCIRYYLNNLGYATYFSILFIILCAFFKSIIQSIVDYVSNVDNSRVKITIYKGSSEGKQLKDLYNSHIINFPDFNNNNKNHNTNSYNNNWNYHNSIINYIIVTLLLIIFLLILILVLTIFKV